jgi:hypothetical protein
MRPEIQDRVKIIGSGDSELDGQIATVVGFYGPDSSIILFDISPADYNPAIVVVNQIIEAI